MTPSVDYIEELCVEDIPTKSSESLLDSLSLEIMETSIHDQITGDLESHRDFLDTVLTKFEAINENADPDSARDVKFEIIDWANRLIVAITDRYGLGYNNMDLESLESLNILESLYHVFILDRFSYTQRFFINYIESNKKQLIQTMDISSNNTDITTIANKKKNVDKDNIPIISNMSEVINYIVYNCDVPPEAFFNYIDDGELYIANVRSYFEEYTLVGDFFQQYVSETINEYGDALAGRLRANIREYLS